MLFVNDSLNKLQNDLTSLENKYVLEMANKKTERGRFGDEEMDF